MNTQKASGGGTRRWRWLALVAAVLLTVANSGRPPSFGVFALSEQKRAVFSLAWDQVYVSQDGGLTWELSPTSEMTLQVDCPECLDTAYLYQLYRTPPITSTQTLVADDQVQYRYAPGSPIQRSRDGGGDVADRVHPLAESGRRGLL